MAHMGLEKYLDQVKKGLVSKSGDILAELFSFRHPHIASPRLQSYLGCGQWALPLMNVVTLDLRLFAMQADKQQVRKGLGKPGEMLEKAAEVMMGCFRVCASDSRSSLEVSKKWGMLALVNHLFKIYFKINKLHLCKPLIRAIDSAPIKDQFKLAHLVTYRYFVGRKAIAILIYLIPVKMLLGYIPKEDLLFKYNLNQFVDVVKSVRMGNLALLNETLEREQEIYGCHKREFRYRSCKPTEMIVFICILRALLLKTHQLSLGAFVVALRAMQVEDIDVTEVECIVANLIYMGYIKGYISHQHQKLVVSKQNPFPALTSFL
ncbi:hypothetical protein pdam_00000969 [Pocillopora damicornis]|uniref:CSN12-like protein n=1 Tax=Pocillopora damicornis TaxID=46731 RepID=A0A3M6T6A6_POCDA|nr:hypothetical protein pdam_00000969 [Pocillopora damicornis]